MRRQELFNQILDHIREGMKITFTPDNLVPDDNFLIFSARESITVTFHTNRVPFWLEFDCDQPILLENCPDCFLQSILRNMQNGNYELKK